MAFSYSFHLSAKSHALGTVNKIEQVSRHNLREYKSDNYDRSQIEILRGKKSILDDVKKIYSDEFSEPLKKYNEGKRDDRKIQNYLQHVSNSKNDCACEFIIQIGDKNFWENKTMAERKQMSYIFQDQIRSLEKLVPELKIASAVVHYDENSPHMHIVGVPVADGYKKGLEKQVSKTKIFTAERLSYLQDRMRENAEKGMQLTQNQNLFSGMELKEKEKGRNKDIPKYALDEYYQLLDQIAQKRDEFDDLIAAYDNAVIGTEARIDRLNEEYTNLLNRLVDEAKEKIDAIVPDLSKTKLPKEWNEKTLKSIDNFLNNPDKEKFPNTIKMLKKYFNDISSQIAVSDKKAEIKDSLTPERVRKSVRNRLHEKQELVDKSKQNTPHYPTKSKGIDR